MMASVSVKIGSRTIELVQGDITHQEIDVIANAANSALSGGGGNREPELLAEAYRTCLELAKEAACQSIAFPSISTGIYGFPENKAAPIALQVVKEHLTGETTIERVVFVLFSNGTFKVFEKALGNL